MAGLLEGTDEIKGTTNESAIQIGSGRKHPGKGKAAMVTSTAAALEQMTSGSMNARSVMYCYRLT
jgi:hypothetical protein